MSMAPQSQAHGQAQRPSSEDSKSEDAKDASGAHVVNRDSLADANGGFMPPAYTVPVLPQDQSTAPTQTQLYPYPSPAPTQPNPEVYVPSPPSSLTPTNHVHIAQHNSRINAQVLLDLAMGLSAPVPLAPVPLSGVGMGIGFGISAKPEKAARKEAKRAEKEAKRARKEEMREQFLALVGYGSQGADAGAGEVVGTGVGLAQVQPNLFLQGHNASMDAEVWVVDTRGGEHVAGRAVLKFVNHNGRVDVAVHAPSSEPRPCISVSISTHSGAVDLALPRTFTGPLALSNDFGHTRLSPALAAASAPLAETHRTQTRFVGRRPTCWRALAMQGGAGASMGAGAGVGMGVGAGVGAEDVPVDEVAVVTRHGTVSVRFEDEPPMGKLEVGAAGVMKRIAFG
ncbi:hypothetical protein DENSPDRAFT_930782 [Dentipellis sp. KUC8613]|nr:hypothetical protein DENSPDRAFT_930782 [Dentipellis sp. KUC8613]